MLDLNRASAEELRLLPGIGPKLAAKIVARRTELGRLDRIEQLDAVGGIGPRKLEAIRPLITLGPRADDQSSNSQPIDKVNAM